MRRSMTSPGGPHVSQVKKQRVEELKNTYGDKRRELSSQGPRGAGDSGGGRPSGLPPNPALGQFPYVPLDDAIKGASLSAYFNGVVGSHQAAAGSSMPRASSWRSGPPGFLELCVDELLSTKRSQTAEARAAIWQRVVDKTILLDNPVKAGSENQQAGLKAKPPGYCDRLVRRPKGRPSIVQQLKHKQLPRKSAVSYSALEALHAMWRSYMAGVLPSAEAPAPAPAASAAGGAGAGAAPEDKLLLQADLHGCLLRVDRSKDVRHVGVRGIVAAITKQCLCIVSPNDDLHVVPVRGTVLQYEAPGGRWVTLHGTAWQGACSAQA